MAATFSGAIQAWLWPLLQASSAGSKSQPIGSEIMPSATPSFASQRASSASMKSLRSLSVRNFSRTGLPDASLGAAWLYATGIHLPIARFESPVRIAGSPETMPLKTVG